MPDSVLVDCQGRLFRAILVEGPKGPGIIFLRILVLLCFVAQNTHVRQNLCGRIIATRLHETDGFAVAFKRLGIVGLLLLKGQCLKNLKVWVQWIQIDCLLQVRECLSAIFARLGLKQTKRGKGIGRIGRGTEDELEVSRCLFIRFGPDEGLRQTEPSR